MALDREDRWDLAHGADVQAARGQRFDDQVAAGKFRVIDFVRAVSGAGVFGEIRLLAAISGDAQGQVRKRGVCANARDANPIEDSPNAPMASELAVRKPRRLNCPGRRLKDSLMPVPRSSGEPGRLCNGWRVLRALGCRAGSCRCIHRETDRAVAAQARQAR